MNNAKTALVTGGSRGIGAATAITLAEQGWDVAISYRERSAEAEKVVASCLDLGRRAIAVRADVAVEADVARLFGTVHDELGRIGAVVNNAGVVSPGARVEAYDARTGWNASSGSMCSARSWSPPRRYGGCPRRTGVPAV